MIQTRYYEFPLEHKELLYRFEENLASDYSVFEGEISITHHFITLTGYVGIIIVFDEDFSRVQRISVDQRPSPHSKYLRLHKERAIYTNRSLESIVNEQYLELLKERGVDRFWGAEFNK